MARRRKSRKKGDDDSSQAAFHCERCGNCCRGDGVVILLPDDVERIAAFLGLKRKEFLAQYTHRVSGIRHPCLLDKDDEAISCIFLEEGGCAVNDVKPHQCATFPSVWSRDDALEFCASLKKTYGK